MVALVSPFIGIDVLKVLSQKMEQVSPPADPQNPHHLNPWWWLFCTDSPYCDLFAAPPLAPLLQKQHTTTATANTLPSRKLTNPPPSPKGWRDITGVIDQTTVENILNYFSEKQAKPYRNKPQYVYPNPWYPHPEKLDSALWLVYTLILQPIKRTSFLS